MKKLFYAIILFLGFASIANAASYSISAGARGLIKGGTTSLTISGSGVTGRFNIKTSDASVISVSEGSIWIENNSYKVTLKALKVGTATITVTPSSGTSDSNGNAVNLGSKSVSISVSLPREKSKNNNLKALSVEGYELSPAFDANVLEYSTTVPSTVDVIKINATKADNYASISGTGEFEVEEGINEFNVIVTSETGSEKNYVVKVMVEDLSPIEVKVGKKSYTVVKNVKNLTKPDNYEDTTVNISDSIIPAFYNDKTKYTLVGLKDEEGNVELFIYDKEKYLNYNEIKSETTTIAILECPEVLKGYQTKEISINDNKIKALVVSNSSSYAIVYGIDLASGEKAYYEYNLKDKTIAKYNDELIIKLQNQNQKISYIMIVAVAGLIIFSGLTIVLLSANNKKKKLINKYIEKNDDSTTSAPKKDAIKKEKLPKKEEQKEEISSETEVYDLFEDTKKKKKKSKK